MANARLGVAVAAEGPENAPLAHTLGNACIRVTLIDRMAPSVQHEDGFHGRTLAWRSARSRWVISPVKPDLSSAMRQDNSYVCVGTADSCLNSSRQIKC